MQYRFTALLIFAILLLAYASSTCAPQKVEAPKPIPNAPDCYTQAKFDAALERVHYRTIVEAYGKVGIHDPKWDDKAVTFLEGYAKTLGKSLDPAQMDKMLKDGEGLLDLGCTDPMVEYAYASTCLIKGSYEKAETYMRKSLEGFEQSKYPKIRVRLAPVTLNKIVKSRRKADPEESKHLAELAQKWNIEMLTDGSFLPGEQRLALKLLSVPLEEFPYPTEMGPYNAVKDLPGIDPYIVGVVGGRCYINQGWKDRGNGWASDVTEEGWKGLEENLRSAYRVLIAAWKLHPEYPEAPSLLIRVAMAGHAAPWETTRLWFDRAVAAQMDCDPAYSRYFESLLPRWGGSIKEVYDFGVECLKTGRFDTNVPGYFANSLNIAVGDVESDLSFIHKPETAEYIKQMWDGYEKSGRLGTPVYCRTMKGLYLWRCGQYESAKAIMDALGKDADPKAFAQVGTSPEKVSQDLVAIGSRPGKGLAEVQALYDTGKLSQALAVCKRVLSESAVDKSTEDYARDWLALLNTEIDLAKGDWVTIPLGQDLTGWTRESGVWAPTDDGGVQGTSDKADARSALYYRANIGSRFEVKGEFESLSPKGSGVAPFVAFNATRRRAEVGFPVDMTQIDVHWLHANWVSTASNPNYQAHNTFDIRYWDGKLSVDVNGKNVGRPFVCPKDRGNEKNLGSDPAVRILLGGISSKGVSIVKFSNLQVRRLDKMPDDIAKKLEEGK